MIDRLDNEISTLRASMNLRAYRQEVLASNIANADTPHYKARDLDFASALANVMAGKADGGLQMKQTSARHLQGEAGAPHEADLKYRTEHQGAVDGNTVKPGAKGCIATKEIEPFKRSHKGILREIVGEFHVAAEPEDQPVDPWRMTLVQGVLSPPVAAPYAFDEVALVFALIRADRDRRVGHGTRGV